MKQVKLGRASARLALPPTGTLGAVTPPVVGVDGAVPVSTVVFHEKPGVDSVATAVGAAGTLSEVLKIVSQG
jgi:hypothetical protein